MNVDLLKTMGKIKKFQEDDFICIENEAGNTAYLLLQGSIEITLGSFTNSIKKIAQLNPGTVFGEMSLLENKPRNASAVAKEDNTIVLEIDKLNFLSILKTDKEIAWNLLCTLLTRAEKMMQSNNLKEFSHIAGYRNNKFYLQIKSLSQEQFKNIIEKDGEHALKLLKFLSNALAEMNDELLKSQ